MYFERIKLVEKSSLLSRCSVARFLLNTKSTKSPPTIPVVTKTPAGLGRQIYSVTSCSLASLCCLLPWWRRWPRCLQEDLDPHRLTVWTVCVCVEGVSCYVLYVLWVIFMCFLRVMSLCMLMCPVVCVFTNWAHTVCISDVYFDLFLL